MTPTRKGNYKIRKARKKSKRWISKTAGTGGAFITPTQEVKRLKGDPGYFITLDPGSGSLVIQGILLPWIQDLDLW